MYNVHIWRSLSFECKPELQLILKTKFWVDDYVFIVLVVMPVLFYVLLLTCSELAIVDFCFCAKVWIWHKVLQWQILPQPLLLHRHLQLCNVRTRSTMQEGESGIMFWVSVHFFTKCAWEGGDFFDGIVSFSFEYQNIKKKTRIAYVELISQGTSRCDNTRYLSQIEPQYRRPPLHWHWLCFVSGTQKPKEILHQLGEENIVIYINIFKGSCQQVNLGIIWSRCIRSWSFVCLGNPRIRSRYPFRCGASLLIISCRYEDWCNGKQQWWGKCVLPRFWFLRVKNPLPMERFKCFPDLQPCSAYRKNWSTFACFTA